MTNYELDKLAKSVAGEIMRRVEENEELLDIMFPPRCMNIKEAAEFLCIPVGTLRQKTNSIPHSRIGKRLVFTDRGLIRYMKREQKEAKA
jgi:hypothetical protein